MQPEGPSADERRRPRRWLVWIPVLFIAALIAAFGLSNAALGSAWGRKFLSDRLRSRTTLDTSIGGASWSPWNGVTFRELRMEQPAPLRASISKPLVRIERIVVRPQWKAMAKGRFTAQSITLTTPEIVLPLEVISHFAPPAPVPTAAPAKPHAAPQPPPAAPKPPVATAEHPPATAVPPPPASPAAPSSPTGFVHLEKASFSVVLGGLSSPVFEISGINGSIPISGDPADASLAIGAIRFLDSETAGRLQLPLRWKSPLLTIPTTDIKVANLATKATAQLAMVSGFPAGLDIAALDQPVPPFDLPGGGRFSAPEGSTAVRYRGLLLSPATWQADFMGSATKPVVRSDGKDVRFDKARFLTVLRGGTLSCVDARITGDDLSLLGNATVLSTGKAAAVLRIVAPPEAAASLVRRLFPGVTSPPAFSRMSTPQRVALDIEASGTLGDLDIRLGKNGPLVGQPSPPASATPK